MPTLIFGTLRQIDRERRRIVVGTADLPVQTDIPLEHLRTGMPIKVVADVRGGEEWVTVLEVDAEALTSVLAADGDPAPREATPHDSIG